jgi:hypothetical protein
LDHPHNIHVYPGTGSATGKAGDILILAPPLDITEESVQEIVARVRGLIYDFFSTFTPTQKKLSADVKTPQKRALDNGDENELDHCDESGVSIAEQGKKGQCVKVE